MLPFPKTPLMATKNKEEKPIEVVYICTQCFSEKRLFEPEECLSIKEAEKFCGTTCKKLTLHRKKKSSKKVPEPSPSP